MLLRVADETVGGYVAEAETSLKKVADNYRLENPRLEPTVTLVVSGGSLEFTVSYIVDYRDRTAMQDLLFTKIVDEIASSSGRLAWASSSSSVPGNPADRSLPSEKLEGKSPFRARRNSN